MNKKKEDVPAYMPPMSSSKVSRILSLRYWIQLLRKINDWFQLRTEGHTWSQKQLNSTESEHHNHSLHASNETGKSACWDDILIQALVAFELAMHSPEPKTKPVYPASSTRPVSAQPMIVEESLALFLLKMSIFLLESWTTFRADRDPYV